MQRQQVGQGQDFSGGPASAGARSAGGTNAFAGSLPSVAAGQTSGKRAAGSASERTATGDLAAAYASPRGAGLPAAATGGAAASTAHASQFTLGLAFLGFGLVALLGGLLVAAARRRREPVRTERSAD